MFRIVNIFKKSSWIWKQPALSSLDLWDKKKQKQKHKLPKDAFPEYSFFTFYLETNSKFKEMYHESQYALYLDSLFCTFCPFFFFSFFVHIHYHHHSSCCYWTTSMGTLKTSCSFTPTSSAWIFYEQGHSLDKNVIFWGRRGMSVEAFITEVWARLECRAWGLMQAAAKGRESGEETPPQVWRALLLP